MQKNTKKPYTLHAFHLPIVILALALGILAYFGYLGTGITGDGVSVLGSNSNKGGNSSNSNKNKKAVETVNSKKYKENTANVVNTLEKVSKTEEEIGNIETSQEIQEVADTQDENDEDIADAISEVESRPKWKTLLIGSDYKNLGQLRSSLVHVTNDIRKLTNNTDEVIDPASQTLLQAQIKLLTEERNRIIDVVVDNKESFSLLGWVVKLFSGNTVPPIGGIGDVDETTESTSGVVD